MSEQQHDWSALLSQQTHRMEMQYHSIIGHLHVPNVVARLPFDQGAYLSKTNSSGFRSDRDFENSRGSRPRILVFGDSFTAGQDCDNHERYSERLGELLDAEIYNYGLSGSAPDQHLLIFEKLAKNVEADLIILGVTVHNIERIKMKFRPSVDRMTGKTLLMPKPYFLLKNGALDLHHVPVPRVRPEIDMQGSHKFLDEQAESSIFQRVTEMAVLRAVKNLLRRIGLADRLRSLLYRASGIQMYDDYGDPNGMGWQLLSAIIRRFSEVANGTPLLVVPLPTYHYVIDRLEPVYDPLFQTLADPKHGLHVYSLTKEFIRGKRLGDRKRLIAGHYTAYGHLAIAELLAKTIRDMGLLPVRDEDLSKAPQSCQSEKPRIEFVLGIAFDTSDSAAVLLRDGEVLAAGQEESFTRVLGQGGFPHLAANYCLEQAAIHPDDLSIVAAEPVHRHAIRDNLSYKGAISSESCRESVQNEDGREPAISQALNEAYGAAASPITRSSPLGPEYSDEEIYAFLDMYELSHERCEPEDRTSRMIELLTQGFRVANFEGRIEYSSKPHGGRCILVKTNDAKSGKRLGQLEVRKLNLDSFADAPYYLRDVIQKITSESDDNSILHSPLRLAGEPIALTPFDAYRVIMSRKIDAAMLGNYLIFRDQQPEWPAAEQSITVA